jgi:hypothetical protein
LSGADAGRGLNKGFPVRGSSEFSTFTASALITIGKGWGGSSWTSYYECSQSSASCFLSVLRSRQPTPRAGSTRLRQCIRTNCRFSRSICCDLSTFRIRAAQMGYDLARVYRDRGIRCTCPRPTLGAGGRFGGRLSSRCWAGSSAWYAYATLTQLQHERDRRWVAPWEPVHANKVRPGGRLETARAWPPSRGMAALVSLLCSLRCRGCCSARHPAERYGRISVLTSVDQQQCNPGGDCANRQHRQQGEKGVGILALNPRIVPTLMH